MPLSTINLFSVVRSNSQRPQDLLRLVTVALLVLAQPSAAQTTASQAAAELRSRWNLEVRWGSAGFGQVTFPLQSNEIAVPLDDSEALAAMSVIRNEPP